MRQTTEAISVDDSIEAAARYLLAKITEGVGLRFRDLDEARQLYRNVFALLSGCSALRPLAPGDSAQAFKRGRGEGDRE